MKCPTPVFWCRARGLELCCFFQCEANIFHLPCDALRHEPRTSRLEFFGSLIDDWLHQIPTIRIGQDLIQLEEVFTFETPPSGHAFRTKRSQGINRFAAYPNASHDIGDFESEDLLPGLVAFATAVDAVLLLPYEGLKSFLAQLSSEPVRGYIHVPCYGDFHRVLSKGCI